MISESVSGPLLTDPKHKSVWWRASVEKQTDCRLVSTMNLQEHQLEIQLESPARWREQWPAQHHGAQPGTGCTTLRSKEVMNLWDIPAGGRGGHCPPLSDTKTQRPATGARPLTWTVLLESSNSTHKQEGCRQKMETSAVMSSKTLLQRGSNTKPATDKVMTQARTDNNELSNINGHQQQRTDSYIRNKDRNFASQSLATSHFFL